MAVTLLLVLATLGGGLANEQGKFERMPATSGDLAGGWQRPQCADLVLAGGSCTAVGGARLAVGAARGLCPGACLQPPEYDAFRVSMGVVRRLWRTWQQHDEELALAPAGYIEPLPPDLRAQRPTQQPRESAVDAPVPTASVPAPTATVEPTATPRADAPTAITASAQPSQDADAVFGMGYIAQGGPEYLLEHFLRDVLPCEGGPTFRASYGNSYVSRAQFDPGSWATVAAQTGLSDPSDPYTVGANVAAWLRLIGVENAGSSSGWPVCFHVGGW